MALNPNTLRDAILNIVANFPASQVAAKVAWADALGQYFAEQAVPLWSPAALAAGKSAFVAAWDPFDKAHFENAINAFAAALSLLPPLGWTAIPPLLPVVLPDLPPTYEPVTPATATATVVDLWARTGSAQMLPDPPVPWS